MWLQIAHRLFDSIVLCRSEPWKLTRSSQSFQKRRETNSVGFWLHFSTTFQILYPRTGFNKSYSHLPCLCGFLEKWISGSPSGPGQSAHLSFSCHCYHLDLCVKIWGHLWKLFNTILSLWGWHCEVIWQFVACACPCCVMCIQLWDLPSH